MLLGVCSAETLEERLRAAKVPTNQFAAQELRVKLTSYGFRLENPFLLAYYVDDGSGALAPPLHVIRYDRKTGSLRRAELRDVRAFFGPGIPGPESETPNLHCLGSVTEVEAHGGFIFLNTHFNPSAGCVIILSDTLELKAAESGWTLGFMGADYAILRRSELHFMAVTPLHVAAFDLRRNKATEIYPFQDDPQRRLFSRLLPPLISREWCVQHDAQCDPDRFNVVPDKAVVNDDAHVFGLETEFNADGFGDAATQRIAPRSIFYFFRARNGQWEHRVFDQRQMRALLGGMSLADFIAKRPEAAFSVGR